MDLKPFEFLINRRAGLTFDAGRLYILREGIERRMQKKFCGNLDSYYNLIISDENEFSELVETLTINETFFFREPAYLKFMAKRLIPEIHDRGKTPISILSAGCSTGEEPCSIAISIAEHMGIEFLDHISIVGGDIDTTALDIAREGFTDIVNFANWIWGLILRYFEPLENGLSRIKPLIPRRISFVLS